MIFKKKKKKPTNKRASAMIKAVVPTRNDDSDDDWKEVLDDASGQTYFWNTRTNETTALGDPKPLQRQQRNAVLCGSITRKAFLAHRKEELVARRITEL